MQRDSSAPGDSIRIFLSSTFEDLRAERDAVAKHVLPSIRAAAAHRGVPYQSVDLRWGVTQEEIDDGQLLEICLAEAQSCSVLVCILGDRYGSVPSEVPADLVRRWPWLSDLPPKSITELEVRAAFARPEGPPPCVCYRRRGTPRDSRILDLATHLSDRGVAVAEFDGTDELKDLITADLLAVVERSTPPRRSPPVRPSETRAFGELLTHKLVGRAEELAALSRLLTQPGSPLALVGAAGVGKTAIMAALAHQAAEEGRRVVTYFLESDEETEAERMLHNLISQAEALAQQGLESPDRKMDPVVASEVLTDEAQITGLGRIEEMAMAFALALTKAATAGEVLVLIDGLQHHSTESEVLPLWWLPPEFHANVKIGVSLTPGPVQDELRRRAWDEYKLEPLPATDRAALIDKELLRFGKRLDPGLVNQLANHPACVDLLYLRVAIDELLVHGDYLTLPEAVAALLHPSIQRLLQHVLVRYETDYDGSDSALTRRAMSSLWASHSGLQLAELLDLLQVTHEPALESRFTRLRHAARSIVTEVDGTLHIANDRIRRALVSRYLDTSQQRLAAHRQLADYFARSPVVERKTDELPWQLIELGDRDGFRAMCADLSFLEEASDYNWPEVQAAWTAYATTGIDDEPASVFSFVIADPGAYRKHLNLVTSLLKDLEDRDSMIKLRDWQIADAETRNDKHALQEALGVRAMYHRNDGELLRALQLYERAQAIAEERDDTAGIILSLIGVAHLYRRTGDLHGAWEKAQAAQKIARANDSPFLTAAAVAAAGNVAGEFLLADDETHDWASASIALRDEQERLARLANAPEVVGNALLTRAAARMAIALHGISDEDWSKMIASDRVRADFLASVQDSLEARRLARQIAAFHLEEHIEDWFNGLPVELPPVWFARSAELVEAGRVDEAFDVLDDLIALGELLDNDDLTADAHGERGYAYLISGRPQEALPHLRREQEIQDRRGNRAKLAESLASEAYGLCLTGDLIAAADPMAQAEQMFAQLGDHRRAASVRRSLAELRVADGELDEALVDLDVALAHARSGGHWDHEATLLVDIGDIESSADPGRGRKRYRSAARLVRAKQGRSAARGFVRRIRDPSRPTVASPTFVGLAFEFSIVARIPRAP